jgi:hypothetical protein
MRENHKMFNDNSEIKIRRLKRAVALAASLAAVSALTGCGNGNPSDRDVQNAGYEWNVAFESKFRQLSDDDKDDIKKQSRDRKVLGCQELGHGYFRCDVEGEQNLWDLQKFDGEWKITGYADRRG